MLSLQNFALISDLVSVAFPFTKITERYRSMRQEVRNQLKQEAQKAASAFSNPNRDYNKNNETYKVDKITPTSEYTAVITFRKSTGIFAIMCAFYIKDRWWTFFPTDSHLEGMRYMPGMKQKIEEANFMISPSNDNRPYISNHEFD